MNRRGILKVGLTYGLLASSVLAVSKPNVIYILADDLGYGDLSCLGQTHFQTPHIDALIKSVRTESPVDRFNFPSKKKRIKSKGTGLPAVGK